MRKAHRIDGQEEEGSGIDEREEEDDGIRAHNHDRQWEQRTDM